jgi:pyridoxal phosphate-dependent aminotransferase EpsN
MTGIKLSAPDFRNEERERINALFDNPLFLFEQNELRQFASDICEYTGIKYGYPVASGTAAMHLAMIICGIERGDHVWSSSMTFMGGISPVTLVGAVPTFIDLSPGSWVIDCDLLEEELAKADARNELPKAIVSTDLYGQGCDMDRLSALSERYGVAIISDSAEGLGAGYKDRHAGKGAKVTILSFNNNKIITSAGGGMLLSDEEWIVKKAEKLANQARENVLHYQHEEIGFNYRMSQISAAMGIEQLKTIQEKIDRRRNIFDGYAKTVGSYEGVEMMPEPEWSRCTRWLSCLTVDEAVTGVNKDKLIQACANKNIETRPLWKPMHMQPVFEGTKFLGTGVCEKLFATGMCLPSGSGMSDGEHKTVIDTLLAELNG